jgi:adenylate kinase family enzyme
MSKYDKETNVFIVDGFPRNEENYLGWCENMGDKAHILCILFLECPENVCTERIMKRSEKSGRVDDNKGSLVKRFNTFMNETCPLIESLENEGKIKIIKINADQTADNVFNNAAEELDKVIVKK